MSNDKKYNGYTNYETWNCSLWIDNDEGSQTYWNNTAIECLDEHDNDKDDAIYDLTERLKSEIEDSSPLTEASMYTDLLNASLSEINFYEIAENFINEVYEENIGESD